VTFASKPLLAVRETIDIINACGGRVGRRCERRVNGRLRRSADYRKAVAAFREDRDLEFVGQ